jgi:hypothetical protein
MLVALSSAMTMLIALELFEQLSAQGRADPIPPGRSRASPRRSVSCAPA